MYRSFFLLFFLALPACAAVDFATEISPILSENCFHCHGPDAADRNADLRLDTEEGALAALVRGNADESELVRRVEHSDADEVMPPPKSKLTLTSEEKRLLREWVEEGAAWAQHWAFVPPERPEVPKVEGAETAIDAFVGRRLKAEGVRPSPAADPVTLIRRVTFDLTGLPPTPAAVADFLKARAADVDAAYEAVVDRLLASPRYGEHMALAWLDAARFADTDGYQYDGPRKMWRWRDWVIEAYNQHMPFDQFTIEQLAGDLLPDATIDQRLATGFNRNHRYNSESGLVVEEFLLENAVDRVDTTSTLWMGLTVGCARCHDHKYDPVSIKEYYELIAFFNSIPEGGRAVKAHNSPPVMRAPDTDQRVEEAKLRKAWDDAEAKLVSDEVEAKLAAWVERVAKEDVAVEGPLVGRGLVFHEPMDARGKSHSDAQGDPVITNGVLVLDGDDELLVKPDEATRKKLGKFAANQRFSVSLWMKATDVGASGVIFSRQDTSHSRKGVSLELVNGKLRFDLVTRWIAGVGRVTTKDPLAVGEWLHVTVTCDGMQSARGQVVYVNGTPVPTDVTFDINSNIGGVGESLPIRLGDGPFGEPFAGAVDDVRIYARDLWPEEVAVLSVRSDLSGLVAGDSEARSDRESAALRAWFFEHAEDTSVRGWVNVAESARIAHENFVRKLPTVMVMEESPTPKPTFVRTRGVYDAHGERVERNVPAVLGAFPEDVSRDRLGFAKWLVSGSHPLTARVAVNRYWQRFFGLGLVKTAEDFGVQGAMPSHPELLDWLATEFVRTGWDVAGMHKRMVMSATYQQASRVRPKVLERDPHNVWLARAPRLRLTGHAIRDQALFASGLLKERVGGPSVSPYQPANLWIEMSMGMKYRQSTGDDLYRRSLYTIWKRTVAPPAMAVFDSADREACWVKMKRTNTPLQALTLLNETGFVESARQLGARMIREGGDDPVGFGFEVLTGREPGKVERSVLEDAWAVYRKQYGDDAKAAKDLLGVGASKAADDLDTGELAAATVLANVLLNLDEVITRE